MEERWEKYKAEMIKGEAQLFKVGALEGVVFGEE